MKKYLLIGIVLCCVTTWGCRDFLDESSQDEIRPSTVNDLEQIMLGSCYFNPQSMRASAENFYSVTDIFTDNLQCFGVGTSAYQAAYEARDAQFLWKDEMFTEEGDGDIVDFWFSSYKGIGACNVVLDFLDRVSGEVSYREHIRGECLVLRAYYYFHLVNFFGMPYNYGDPSENLGVPLQLTSAVKEVGLPRNTVQEVYDLIVSDMIRGRELMVLYPMQKNYFRIDPVTAAAMLSRVYLYMEDWDNAITYADSVLKEKNVLLDLNTLTPPDRTSTKYAPPSVLGSDTPDEIIWVRPYGKNFYSAASSSDAKAPWALSDEFTDSLLGGYSPTVAVQNPELINDRRALFYFAYERTGSTYYLLAPDKPLNRDQTYGKTQGIHTAEVYLNRAEAYIHKFMKEGNDSYRQKALHDLNFLRQHRYAIYEPLDIQDAQDLLDVYKMERRKELAGEGNHRWFDIRRFNETFTHTAFTKIGEEQTETLREALYVLPIPQEALNRNANLKQNVRN